MISADVRETGERMIQSVVTVTATASLPVVVSERRSYNEGYCACRWDGLGYQDCLAIEGMYGSVTSFWDGWHDAFSGLPNKAADTVRDTGGGLQDSLNYLCREALWCVHRDSQLGPGRFWVYRTVDMLARAVNGIFPPSI